MSDCETKQGVKLKSGEWYVTVAGEIIGPAAYVDPGDSMPFKVGGWWYSEDGRFNTAMRTSDDIIAHVPITDRRHPNYVKPPLELEFGEYYVDAAGVVIGPLTRSGISTMPFGARVDEYSINSYYPDGRWTLHYQDSRDLIKHLPVNDPRHPLHRPDPEPEDEPFLQVGEFYLTRGGDVIGPVLEYGSEDYPFIINGTTYRADGRYANPVMTSPRDLLEHIPVTDERHPNYQEPVPEPTTKMIHLRQYLCRNTAANTFFVTGWTTNQEIGRQHNVVMEWDSRQVEIPANA